MKCPRCQATFTATADAAGSVVCSSCGARLRVRPAEPPPPSPEPPPRVPPPPPKPPPPPRREASSPAAPAKPNPPETVPAPAADRDAAAVLRQLLDEMRALRTGQERVLSMLEALGAGPTDGFDGRDGGGMEPLFDFPSSSAPSARAPHETPVRSRRRKTVLLIDDDAATRQEALDAMLAAEVPARAAEDGNAGVAAIAEERPDVIVLELAMGGSMAGKDVVNLIKATMEWVDIPIVLYTRLPVESQKEARQVHGADEVVLKGPASAAALVARVISVFRRP